MRDAFLLVPQGVRHAISVLFEVRCKMRVLGFPVFDIHGREVNAMWHMIAAKVFTTTEIFIANIKNSNVKKKHSEMTNLNEMRNDLT